MNIMILAWLSWFIVALFYGYQYILRVMPAVIMEKVSKDFALNPESFGDYQSIYYLGYTLAHIPLGILLDRVSSKIIISFCILLTIIGSLPLIFDVSWSLVLAGRFLVGAGSACAILSAFKLCRTAFTSTFSLMIGLLATIGVIGAIFGGAPISFLVNTVGYDNMLLFVMGIGFAIFVLAVLLLPNKKGEERFIGISAKEDAKNPEIEKINADVCNTANTALGKSGIKGICNDLLCMFSNVRFFIIVLAGGLMMGPLEGFADAWSVTFFETVYRFNIDAASYVPSVIFFGFAVGAPIIGYFSDKSGAHYLILLICGLVSATVLFIFINAWMDFTIPIFSFNLNILYVLLFFLGFVATYQIILIDKALHFLPLHLAALGSAVINMLLMFFGSIFHKILGYTINHYWDGVVVDGVNIYKPEVFEKALATLDICIIFAMVLFIYLMLSAVYKSKKIGKNY